MYYPVKGIGISQYYSNSHKALDLGWNNNYGGTKAPVYAVEDGIVYKIGVEQYGGNILVIKHTIHGKVYYSKYAHLSIILVKVGDSVKALQQVANMGNTGINKATGKRVGYHLHIEIFENKYNSLFKRNPIEYLFVATDQIVLSNTEKKYGKLILRYGQTKTCTGNKVRIRKSPGISLLNKTGNVLNKNDKVKVYAYSNNFYKISSDKELWVSATYLK